MNLTAMPHRLNQREAIYHDCYELCRRILNGRLSPVENPEDDGSEMAEHDRHHEYEGCDDNDGGRDLVALNARGVKVGEFGDAGTDTS